MKFFCHLKVCDTQFNRTVFVVKYDADSTFSLEPVQNHTSFSVNQLPALKLVKKESEWVHELTSGYLTAEVIKEIEDKLEGKLEDYKHTKQLSQVNA